MLYVILDGVRQPVEGRGRQKDTMRAVTVYRLDDSSNFRYHTRHPVGSVIELRIYERVNNYKDLLRLARRLFALDTADADHVLIDVGQGRQAYLPEQTREPSKEGREFQSRLDSIRRDYLGMTEGGRNTASDERADISRRLDSMETDLNR